jgi:hypothetical protein
MECEMKKIVLLTLSILAFSICSFSIDTYASLGIDGSHNMGYKAGLIFKAQVFEPLKDDYLSYTSTSISSADKVGLNSGRSFNVTEILFRKLRDNIYIGAGQEYMITDTNAWTKKDFATVVGALYYPATELRLLFQYVRANDNDISGVNLSATYLIQGQYTIECWGGFYQSRYIPNGKSGYSFGSTIGIKLF